MKNKLKNRNRIILAGIIVLVLAISFIIFYKLDSDGMNNNGIYNIKYKVYQNGKWTKNSKNGMIVGDKEHPIQNISISIRTNEKTGSVYYYAYTNNWSNQTFDTLENNANQIYGLKFYLSNLLYKKYQICYRTYNKKDKWLNWTCSGEISGNKEEPITALEIKIIPQNTVRPDYLKDYNKKLKSKKNF